MSEKEKEVVTSEPKYQTPDKVKSDAKARGENDKKERKSSSDDDYHYRGSDSPAQYDDYDWQC